MSTDNEQYVDPAKLIANLEDVPDIDTNQNFDRPLVEEGVYTASISYDEDDVSKRWAARNPSASDKEPGRRWYYTALKATIISGKTSGEQFKGRRVRDGYVSTMVMDGATKVSRICVALNQPIEKTPKAMSHEGQVQHLNTILSRGDAICNIQVAWEATFSVKVEEEDADPNAKANYIRFDKAKITGTRSALWPKDEEGKPLRKFTRVCKYVDPDDPTQSQDIEVEARVQEVITRYNSVAQ